MPYILRAGYIEKEPIRTDQQQLASQQYLNLVLNLHHPPTKSQYKPRPLLDSLHSTRGRRHGSTRGAGNGVLSVAHMASQYYMD